MFEGVPWVPSKNIGYCQAKPHFYRQHLTYRNYQTQSSQAGAYIEPLFLQASVLGIGRYSECYQKSYVNMKQLQNFQSKIVTGFKIYASEMLVQSFWDNQSPFYVT